MKATTVHDVNQRAYRKLRTTIARTYPHGRFVAIHAGKIVADAEDFDQLVDALDEMDLNPRDTLIAQAGVYLPEKVHIFI